ncbi:hypothetical protein [Planococcus lenghuensis]|uniref:Uncharacterized protein n=1 Tax=Planococcus lenghuensis TaxID=2213202 RepID=A0A1Q2KYK2_9BACL|nr:hypothetical protein [Planococcus lenghuensis]AQQ53216.1 hypothetical protein B0X71_09080 [Planococcus lenghuensis]
MKQSSKFMHWNGFTKKVFLSVGSLAFSIVISGCSDQATETISEDVSEGEVEVTEGVAEPSESPKSDTSEAEAEEYVDIFTVTGEIERIEDEMIYIAHEESASWTIPMEDTADLEVGQFVHIEVADHTPEDDWDPRDFEVMSLEVISEAADFEYIQYDGKIFSEVPDKEISIIESRFGERQLLGQITEQAKGSIGIQDFSASHLPIGTKIYAPVSEGDEVSTIVAEMEGADVFYQLAFEM